MEKKNFDNDNEPISFVSLAALTANVTRYLELTKKEHEDSERQTGRNGTEKDNSKDHSDYVDQRLRELAAFERKVSGRKD